MYLVTVMNTITHEAVFYNLVVQEDASLQLLLDDVTEMTQEEKDEFIRTAHIKSPLGHWPKEDTTKHRSVLLEFATTESRYP